MADKPTYVELEQGVKELAQEHGKLKQLEKKLLQESTMRNVLLDNLPCVALILKKGTREIVAFNQVAKQFGAVPGKTCYETVAQRADNCPFCLAPDLWATGEPQHLEVEYRGTYYEGIWVPLTEKLYVHYLFDITERKQVEEALRESEEKYRHLFTTVSDVIMVFDAETKEFIDANDAVSTIYGYSKEEFLELKHTDITVEPEKSNESIKQTISGEISSIPLRYHKRKDGTTFPVEISSGAFKLRNRQMVYGVVRDITERKQAQESLEQAHDELEHRVQERTRELELKTKSLEELNAALKILINKRQEDQEEFQEGILTNIKILVEPYLSKLKKSKLPQSQKTLLNILESNLNEIISPFTKRLSSQYLNLTPKEIKIANLVKHGKTNKEIAEIQGVASRTIAAHRENIRKKLGLTNKKANLTTYLQTLF